MHPRQDANDPEYVKGLLGMQKSEVICRLLVLIPMVSDENPELKHSYLKIFPVFFSHAEVFTQEIVKTTQLIAMLMRHPIFGKERHLFEEWYARFTEIKERMLEAHSKRVKNSLRKPHVVVCKNSNRFLLIAGTHFVDTIGYSEIDFFNSFYKYLKLHKLHKYLVFFANLSYVEIMSITSENIQQFERKVGIEMTLGARNAILRKLTDLELRSNRLKMIIRGDEFSIPTIERYIEEMKNLLRTPIRGNTVYEDENGLPNLIVKTVYVLTEAVLEKIRMKNVNRVAEDLCALLRRAWSCYFFNEVQKAEFNVLRNSITTTLLNSEFDKLSLKQIRQQQAPPVSVAPIAQKTTSVPAIWRQQAPPVSLAPVAPNVPFVLDLWSLSRYLDDLLSSSTDVQ